MYHVNTSYLPREYSSQLPVQLGLLAPSKRKPCSEPWSALHEHSLQWGTPFLWLTVINYFEIMLKITNILYVLSYMSSVFNFCYLIDENCVTHGV